MSAILAIVLASFYAAPARITYETRAVPLVRLLDELSARTGTDLRCEARLRTAPMVVSVTDVETTDLLAKIAEVVGAEWRKEKDHELLAQSPAQIRKEERVSLATQIDKVRRALAGGIKDLQPNFEKQDADGLFNSLATLKARLADDRQNRALTSAYGDMALRTPLNRALIRLVQTIPPEDIARADERTVFALNPTAKQRPLGPGADRILADFVREQTVWVDALRRLDPEEKYASPSVREPMGQRDVPASADAVRVVLTRRVPAEYLFSLVVISGNPLEAGRPWTQWAARSPEMDRIYETIWSSTKDGSKPIPLTALSEELARQLRASGRGEGGVRVGPDLKAWLLDPVAHEPMDLVPSECLLEVARARGKPLVAWIPDVQLPLLTSAASQGALTLRTHEQFIRAELGSMALREESGWVLGIPDDPVLTRRRFTDRQATKGLARAIEEKGGVRLIDYARYAASTGGSRHEHGGPLSMLLLDPTSGVEMGQMNWSALKVYGSLTDQQLRDLTNGGRLRVDRMTPAQKRFVEELAYASEINRAANTTTAGFSTIGKTAEPTVALAGGLPADAELTLTSSLRPRIFAFKPVEGQAPVAFQTLDPSTVALYERIASGDLVEPNVDQKIAGYAMGESVMIRLRLTYSPDLWHEVAMEEKWIDRTAIPKPWTELPESIAAAVRAALERKPPPLR